MIINKEGKLFGKISIIDIIIIGLLAVLAFGIYTKFNSPINTEILDFEEDLEYTISIKNVPSGTIYALEHQGQLTNSDTNQKLGEIVDLSYTSAKEVRTFSDGTTGEFDIPQHFDVNLVVHVKGKIGNSGYYTSDNFPLHIGTELTFNTKYVTAPGTITDVKKINK